MPAFHLLALPPYLTFTTFCASRLRPAFSVLLDKRPSFLFPPVELVLIRVLVDIVEREWYIC